MVSAWASMVARMCAVERERVVGLSGCSSMREVAGERLCHWSWEAMAY